MDAPPFEVGISVRRRESTVSTTYQCHTCTRVSHLALKNLLPRGRTVSEESPLNVKNPGLVVILNGWDRLVAKLEIAKSYLAVDTKKAAGDFQARRAAGAFFKACGRARFGRWMPIED